MDDKEILKIVYSANSPSILNRIKGYQKKYPQLSISTIRYLIYEELTEGSINHVKEPLLEYDDEQLEITKLFDKSENPYRKTSKDDGKKIFKTYYADDGSFQVASYPERLYAQDQDFNKYIEDYNKTKSTKEQLPLIKYEPKTRTSFGDIVGIFSNDKYNKEYFNKLPYEKRKSLREHLGKEKIEEVEEAYKGFAESTSDMMTANFMQGIMDGLEYAFPYVLDMGTPFTMDEEIGKLNEEKSFIDYLNTDEKVIDKKTIDKDIIDKPTKSWWGNTAAVVSRATGNTVVLMAELATIGNIPLKIPGAIAAITTKFPKLLGATKRLQKVQSKFDKLIKTSSESPILREAWKSTEAGKWGKYFRGFGARTAVAGTQGTINIPAGLHRYYDQPEDEKDFWYDVFIEPVLETMSEGMMISRFGLPNNLRNKTLTHLGGMLPNFITEEFTNIGQDVAKGTKSSILHGWGDAQTAAAGISLIFGSGGATLSALGHYKDIKAMEYGGADVIKEFVASNKYKLSNRLGDFVELVRNNSHKFESMKRLGEAGELFLAELEAGRNPDSFQTELTQDTKEKVSLTKQIENDPELIQKIQNDYEAYKNAYKEQFGVEPNAIANIILLGRARLDNTFFAGDRQSVIKEMYNKDVSLKEIHDISQEIAVEYEAKNQNRISYLKLLMRQNGLYSNDSFKKAVLKLSDSEVQVFEEPEQEEKLFNLINQINTEGVNTLTEQNFSKYGLNSESFMNIIVNGLDKKVKQSYKEQLKISEAVKIAEDYFKDELNKPKDFISDSKTIQVLELIANNFKYKNNYVNNELAVKAITKLSEHYAYAERAADIQKNTKTRTKREYDDFLKKRYSDPEEGIFNYIIDVASITQKFNEDFNSELNKLGLEEFGQKDSTLKIKDSETETDYVERVIKDRVKDTKLSKESEAMLRDILAVHYDNIKSRENKLLSTVTNVVTDLNFLYSYGLKDNVATLEKAERYKELLRVNLELLNKDVNDIVISILSLMTTIKPLGHRKGFLFLQVIKEIAAKHNIELAKDIDTLISEIYKEGTEYTEKFIESPNDFTIEKTDKGLGIIGDIQNILIEKYGIPKTVIKIEIKQQDQISFEEETTINWTEVINKILANNSSLKEKLSPSEEKDISKQITSSQSNLKNYVTSLIKGGTPKPKKVEPKEKVDRTSKQQTKKEVEYVIKSPTKSAKEPINEEIAELIDTAKGSSLVEVIGDIEDSIGILTVTKIIEQIETESKFGNTIKFTDQKEKNRTLSYLRTLLHNKLANNQLSGANKTGSTIEELLYDYLYSSPIEQVQELAETEDNDFITKVNEIFKTTYTATYIKRAWSNILTAATYRNLSMEQYSLLSRYAKQILALLPKNEFQQVIIEKIGYYFIVDAKGKLVTHSLKNKSVYEYVSKSIKKITAENAKIVKSEIDILDNVGLFLEYLDEYLSSKTDIIETMDVSEQTETKGAELKAVEEPVVPQEQSTTIENKAKTDIVLSNEEQSLLDNILENIPDPLRDMFPVQMEEVVLDSKQLSIPGKFVIQNRKEDSRLLISKSYLEERLMTGLTTAEREKYLSKVLSHEYGHALFETAWRDVRNNAIIEKGFIFTKRLKDVFSLAQYLSSHISKDKKPGAYQKKYEELRSYLRDDVDIEKFIQNYHGYFLVLLDPQGKLSYRNSNNSDKILLHELVAGSISNTGKVNELLGLLKTIDNLVFPEKQNTLFEKIQDFIKRLFRIYSVGLKIQFDSFLDSLYIDLDQSWIDSKGMVANFPIEESYPIVPYFYRAPNEVGHPIVINEEYQKFWYDILLNRRIISIKFGVATDMFEEKEDVNMSNASIKEIIYYDESNNLRTLDYDEYVESNKVNILNRGDLISKLFIALGANFYNYKTEEYGSANKLGILSTLKVGKEDFQNITDRGRGELIISLNIEQSKNIKEFARRFLHFGNVKIEESTDETMDESTYNFTGKEVRTPPSSFSDKINDLSQENEEYYFPTDMVFDNEKTDEDGNSIITTDSLWELKQVYFTALGIREDSASIYEFMENVTLSQWREMFDVKNTQGTPARVIEIKKQMREIAIKNADFEHNTKLSKEEVINRHIDDMYVKYKSQYQYRFVTVRNNGNNIHIQYERNEFRNSSGTKRGSFMQKPIAHDFLPILSELFDNEVEIIMVNEYVKGQQSGKRVSEITAQQLAETGFRIGLIYPNQFADRKTQFFFRLKREIFLNTVEEIESIKNGDSKNLIVVPNLETEEETVNNLETNYNEYYKIADYQLSNGEKGVVLSKGMEYYYKRVIAPLYATYKKALYEEGVEFLDETSDDLSVKAMITTLTIRTLLEDLKYDNTLENILAGNTTLKGKDMVTLMKRWVLASLQLPPAIDNLMINDLIKQKLISENEDDPIFVKDGMVYYNTILLDTENTPEFLNALGIPRFDGSTFALSKQYGEVHRQIYGSVNYGGIKTFGFFNGMYFKHAVAEINEKDRLWDLVSNLGVSMIITDTAEKNNPEGRPINTIEDIRTGNVKKVAIPATAFHRIKEEGNFNTTVLGLSQIANSTNMTEQNKNVDPYINSVFNRMAREHADWLNKLIMKHEARELKKLVDAMLANPNKSTESKMFAGLYGDILKELNEEETLDFLVTMRRDPIVRLSFGYYLSDKIKNSVKLINKGRSVFLIPDMGEWANTRLDQAKKQIAEQNLEVSDFLDENEYLKETSIFIPPDVAKSLNLKIGDYVIGYVVPSDSALSFNGFRIAGISDTMPVGSIAGNSEYFQGLMGKDFDADRIYLIPKLSWMNDQDWAHFIKALNEKTEKYVNGMYYTFNKVFYNNDLVLRLISEAKNDPTLKFDISEFKLLTKQISEATDNVKTLKTKVILNSTFRKRFMQLILGVNNEARPEGLKYNPIEAESINVGDMFYKDIGGVIRLRELFSLLSINRVKGQVEDTAKSDPLIAYDFESGGEKWDIIHTMLLIATNDTVDYPKNANKNYYNSDMISLFTAMLDYNINYNSMRVTTQNAISKYYNFLLGASGIYTQLLSIPRFKSKASYSNDRIEDATFAVEEESDKTSKDSFAENYAQSKMIATIERIKKFKERVKTFPKYFTRIALSPIGSLAIDVKEDKLLNKIHTFFYPTTKKEIKELNSRIENEAAFRMIAERYPKLTSLMKNLHEYGLLLESDQYTYSPELANIVNINATLKEYGFTFTTKDVISIYAEMYERLLKLLNPKYDFYVSFIDLKKRLDVTNATFKTIPIHEVQAAIIDLVREKIKQQFLYDLIEKGRVIERSGFTKKHVLANPSTTFLYITTKDNHPLKDIKNAIGIKLSIPIEYIKAGKEIDEAMDKIPDEGMVAISKDFGNKLKNINSVLYNRLKTRIDDLKSSPIGFLYSKSAKNRAAIDKIISEQISEILKLDSNLVAINAFQRLLFYKSHDTKVGKIVNAVRVVYFQKAKGTFQTSTEAKIQLIILRYMMLTKNPPLRGNKQIIYGSDGKRIEVIREEKTDAIFFALFQKDKLLEQREAGSIISSDLLYQFTEDSKNFSESGMTAISNEGTTRDKVFYSNTFQESFLQSFVYDSAFFSENMRINIVLDYLKDIEMSDKEWELFFLSFLGHNPEGIPVGNSLIPDNAITNDRHLLLMQILNKRTDLISKFGKLKYEIMKEHVNVNSEEVEEYYFPVLDEIPIENINDVSISEIKNLLSEGKIKDVQILLKRGISTVQMAGILKKNNLSYEQFVSMSETEQFGLSMFMDVEYIEKYHKYIDTLTDTNTILHLQYWILKALKYNFDKESSLFSGKNQMNIDKIGLLASRKLFLSNLPLPKSISFIFKVGATNEQDYLLDPGTVFSYTSSQPRNPEKSLRLLALSDIFLTKKRLLDEEITKLKSDINFGLDEEVFKPIENKKLDHLEKIKLFQRISDVINQMKDKKFHYGVNRLSYKKKSIEPKELLEELQITDIEAGLYALAILKNIAKAHKMISEAENYFHGLSIVEDSEQQKFLYKTFQRKYYRLRKYIYAGAHSMNSVAKGDNPRNKFVPKIWTRANFINAFVRDKFEWYQKKSPSLSAVEVYDKVRQIAERIVGKREYIIPMFKNPLDNELPYSDVNYVLGLQTFVEELTTMISKDVTQTYWHQYNKAAKEYGENKYTYNLMRRWFINNKAGRDVYTNVADKKEIKKDQIILFYIEGTTTIYDEGRLIEVGIKVAKSGRVKDINDKEVIISSGDSEKIYQLVDIGTFDDKNVFDLNKVEIYNSDFMNKSRKNMGERFSKVVEVLVLIMRGGLGRWKSRLRNLLGGRAIVASREMQDALSSTGSRNKEVKDIIEKLSDVSEKEKEKLWHIYNNAKQASSQFGNRTLLDVFYGSDPLEVDPQDILSDIDKEGAKGLFKVLKTFFRVFKKIVLFKKLRGQSEELLKVQEELDKKIKDTFEEGGSLKRVDEINKLKDLSFLLADNTDATIEEKEYKEKYKPLIDRNNLAFIYNISPRQAERLLKRYLTEIIPGQLMRYVNKDETYLRMASFEMMFLNSYSIHGDFTKAIIDAKQGVKVDNALYDATNKIIGSTKGWGRGLNALRTFTFNQQINFYRLLRDLKADVHVKGWMKLLKDLSQKEESNPLRGILNQIVVNMFLYNMSNFIPGLLFVGNPLLMTMIQMVDILASSFDEDDEDKPNRMDLFYFFLTIMQLRGGVGKSMFWNAAIANTVDSLEEEAEGIFERVIKPTFYPFFRDYISAYKLFNNFTEESSNNDYDAFRFMNNLSRFATGFSYYNETRDLSATTFAGSILKYGLLPLSTYERLTSNPIERKIEKNIEKQMNIDYEDYYEVIENKRKAKEYRQYLQGMPTWIK